MEMDSHVGSYFLKDPEWEWVILVLEEVNQ